MTEAQMRELVSATFATAWAVAAPGVPLVLENEAVGSTDSYAMLTITMTTASQMTQGRPGTRRVKRSAWIQVKLWTPANEGALEAATLADAVRVILEMVDMPSPVAGDEPVTTLAAWTMPGEDSGRWRIQLVRVPCWFVQTK